MRERGVYWITAWVLFGALVVASIYAFKTGDIRPVAAIGGVSSSVAGGLMFMHLR